MARGLADQLKKALVTYTESGGQGNPTFDTAQAIAVMLEKHGIACDMMHGFSWKKWTSGTPTERLQLIPAGQEHILEQDDGKKRWVQVVTKLSSAFALCAASDEATAIRDDVSFFQALQAALNKQSSQNRKTPEQIDAAIRQLVSKAITTEGQVIDVFTAAGLTPSPPAQSGYAQCCALSVSVAPLAPSAAQAGHQHSERPIPRRSARPQAQERRRRAAGEAAQGRTQGALQAQPRAEPGVGSGIPMPAGFAHRFALPVSHAPAARLSEKLKKTLNAYHNRAISTMQVIEELIQLAKDLDAATKRGEDMGLTDDEVALTPSLPLSRAAPIAPRCLSRSLPPRLGATTPSPPTTAPCRPWAMRSSR